MAMDSLKSSFIFPPTLSPLPPPLSTRKSLHFRRRPTRCCAIVPDPWSPRDGSHLDKPKPRQKNPKNPLSDDNARRIIKSRAQYLSVLRRNQGSTVQTPRWIRRSPEQMVQYLEDDRNGHLYGKHVVAAIRTVRALSQTSEGSYDMREVMASFVLKLTFREMCVVLKEQRGWRQVRDFFAWMKLQLCYRPCVIAYTIVLRAYGQVGKIKLAEEAFLEMLDAGCEPDEIACGTMLCTYARWGRHNAMLSFYLAVQERGVILQLSVYNFMLSSLQKKSHHEGVVQIWGDMTGKGVVPNHFTSTIVICSLVKAGLYKDALKTFRDMKSLGFVPEEATYCHLITSCVKEGQKDEALRLYGDMRSLGIVPSSFTCASLLTLYYKTGDYSKALSLFSEMEDYKIPADEVISGLMIRIYGKLGLFEDAQRTFELTEKLGLLSDEKTYIAMAQVHLSSGNHMRALNSMEQMRARGIGFSRFAYIVMLKCHIMEGDVGSAEGAFQSLQKISLPDAGSCNGMLKMYMRLGLLEKAKDFIVQIRRDRVEFDGELCRTVVKLYSKEAMLTDVEQLIEELRISGSLNNSFTQTIGKVLILDRSRLKDADDSFLIPDPDALSLMLNLYLTKFDELKIENIIRMLLSTENGFSAVNQLLGKLCHEGDMKKAEILYDKLISLDARPDDSTMASMIISFGKQQSQKKAREMLVAWTEFSTLGAQTYKLMIDALTRRGEIQQAFNIYKEAVHKGCAVGAVSISMLVNNLINQDKYREAEEVITSSFDNDLELDTVAYNTFIKAMLGAGKLHRATTIYDRMISSGISPSIQTYSTMMSVYGRRHISKAVEMFNMAQQSGLSLDERVYTNMIGIYGKAGKIEEASLLYSKMLTEGIKPGKISYNVMVSLYAAAGLVQKAEEFFDAMHKDGFLPDSLTYLALIQVYAASLNHEKAEEAIASMQKKGFSPSLAHFNVLISSYTKAGCIVEAERVFENMLLAGVSPDLVCCRTMVRGYLDYGYAGKGISFFERISGSVKPDKFIMSAAVLFYRSAGMESEAEGISNSMKKLGLPYIGKLELGMMKNAPMTIRREV